MMQGFFSTTWESDYSKVIIIGFSLLPTDSYSFPFSVQFVQFPHSGIQYQLDAIYDNQASSILFFQ